jgi:hypothetical protein
MTTSERIYRRLLDTPGDRDAMLVLADALDDEGHDRLAAAYRWAAGRGKWPFRRFAAPTDVRREMCSEVGEAIYDWDSESRVRNVAPADSKLPVELFERIRFMQFRRYGDVNQAFALLANALAGNKEYQPMDPWPAEATA